MAKYLCSKPQGLGVKLRAQLGAGPLSPHVVVSVTSRTRTTIYSKTLYQEAASSV